jgi:hypothetical protein
MSRKVGSTKSRVGYALTRSLLVLALSLGILANWKLSTPVLTMYYKMGRIQAWDGNDVELSALNDVAHSLIQQSEMSRRTTVAAYNVYSRNHIAASYKLLLLMRLLFDLPEEYRENDAQVFDNFWGEGERNPLWPLGYDENGQLILKYDVLGWQCFGLCPYYYDGLAEYDYFVARFPLRVVGEE